MLTNVWVKFKVRKDGTPDTAIAIYCEEQNNGFEASALQSVLEATFPVKLKRRRVDRSWFYTKVRFLQIDSMLQDNTDSYSSIEYRLEPDCPESLVVMPELVRRWRPKYPRAALLNGKSAVVTLRVLVDERGIPVRSFVQESTEPEGKFGFQEAALKAVKKCKFMPMLCDGQPKKCWVSFPYEFVLRR